MKKEDRPFIYFLIDIFQFIEKVEDYTAGITYEEFIRDERLMDAVFWNVEKIGEASTHIPQEIKDAHPELPWDEMYRCRNILSHSYFTVRLDIVWKIATVHLPQNKKAIQEIIIEQSPR